MQALSVGIERYRLSSLTLFVAEKRDPTLKGIDIFKNLNDDRVSNRQQVECGTLHGGVHIPMAIQRGH